MPFAAANHKSGPRREGVDNRFRSQKDKMTSGRTPNVPGQERPARRFRKQSGGHDFQQVTPRRTEFKSLQPLRLNRESFFGCVQIQLINNDGVWSDSILTKSE